MTLADELAAVVDPALFHSLNDLSSLLDVQDDGELVRVKVAEPLAEYPAIAELEGRLTEVAKNHGRRLEVELVTLDAAAITALANRLRSLEAPRPEMELTGGVRASQFAERAASTRVLAISSGKGGVGKSTVTVNLAVALARLGHRVGLLDADVYGFSVPRMLGVAYPPILVDKVIVPPVGFGVRVVSMGLFMDEDKAVAWRGPMLHKALEQFLVDVHWGELDYLLVDMPPGTGDVALSVAEQLPGAELYIVSTPQPSAQRIAQRSGALARQLRMSVRGVIENMSQMTTPDGQVIELFGSGGGQALADEFKVPLLSQIPFDIDVRKGADEGVPAVVVDEQSAVARAFAALAERIVGAGPARVYRSKLSVS